MQTKKGLEKALRKSGSLLDKGAPIVESATVMEEKTVKIPIPGLLGDPDIPSALIKNPTRTIKIERLTKGTSSCQIAEALTFCKSNISGYTLGSSHSVAYVEFEVKYIYLHCLIPYFLMDISLAKLNFISLFWVVIKMPDHSFGWILEMSMQSEIGKERALAKQSINILGKQLPMLRIDCPRTTVVRISTVVNQHIKEIKSICQLLGNVNLIKRRSSSTLDVHFKLAEWPNMVKILNGYTLNIHDFHVNI